MNKTLCAFKLTGWNDVENARFDLCSNLVDAPTKQCSYKMGDTYILYVPKYIATYRTYRNPETSKEKEKEREKKDVSINKQCGW